MKIKNISETIQMLAGFASFKAGEERTVSSEDGSIILRNQNFEEIKAEKKVQKKEKK